MGERMLTGGPIAKGDQLDLVPSLTSDVLRQLYKRHLISKSKLKIGSNEYKYVAKHPSAVIKKMGSSPLETTVKSIAKIIPLGRAAVSAVFNYRSKTSEPSTRKLTNITPLDVGTNIFVSQNETTGTLNTYGQDEIWSKMADRILQYNLTESAIEDAIGISYDAALTTYIANTVAEWNEYGGNHSLQRSQQAHTLGVVIRNAMHDYSTRK